MVPGKARPAASGRLPPEIRQSRQRPDPRAQRPTKPLYKYLKQIDKNFDGGVGND
jgi:hypothetical protein